MPASLEKRPRATPKRMASRTVMPATPPAIACGSKASTKICAKAWPRLRKFAKMTTSEPRIYSTAITGTIFSVTEAMRFLPPRKITAAIAATTMPTAMPGTPNAFRNESLMELHCTMLPMKPSASVMATAKKPARNLPNLPLNRALM